ncbi:MAG: flagellar motor switch protein FliM [Alphaproteobacteria bacterium]|jgi:flagellar motor switch protein FliM|nr:flagellar motor switch protein FliM [Alphaproteobacteria bacterium]
MSIEEKPENQESIDSAETALEPTQSSKDDALAGEWEDSDALENTSVESLSPKDPIAARVLNQEEIDSLLGFDEIDSAEQQNGLYAIINSSLVSYERLPMLEVVFDRLIRVLSTSLRNFTSDNVEVSLDGLQSFRFGDYLNSIPLPAMLGVFKAEEWENYGLVIVDSPLIYSIVDVLLGGRRGTAMMRVEGRPYTTIERNLVERMLFLVLNDMSAAFDPLSPVTFRFERLETNPRFTAIARPANAAVVVKLRIDMEDRGGRLEIVLPYATLEPVRELLLQMFMGEKFGRDSIWENHLINELLFTKINMLAVIDEFMLPLSEVMKWKVGTQISLNCTPSSPVELRCASVPLFVGQMGKKNNKISIKIDRKYREEADELES